MRRLFGSITRPVGDSLMGNSHGVKTVCGETKTTSSSGKMTKPDKYAAAAAASSPSPAVEPSNIKCRNGSYPNYENVNRFTVPDSKVPWNVPFPDYAPVDFTHPAVAKGPVWADPPLPSPSFNPQWNAKDGKINRKSFVKMYNAVDGKPVNPIGRTGVIGRGLLGKWGPNHAADPIVTRWKRDVNGEKIKNETSGLPVLQFVSIQRKDSLEWAIPGGMVDDDEEVSLALKREFGEEALNSLQATDEQKEKLEAEMKRFFANGNEIFKGYVDDPRNTDNAWMETVAVNFHDDSGSSVGRFPLAAGDDAGDVVWKDVDKSLKLYASHASFIAKTAQLLKAHW